MNVQNKLQWEKINDYESTAHFVSNQDEHLIYLKKWQRKGNGEKEKVIFLFHDVCQYHGRFLSFIKWTQNQDQDVTFVAMDFVGHGCSSGTRGHFDQFDFLVKDVFYFLFHEEKIENQEWYLVGHGLGGLAILDLLNRYAVNFESKIDGLIISNFIFHFNEIPFMKFLSDSLPKFSSRLRLQKIFLGNEITSDYNEAILFEQDALILHRPTFGVLESIKEQSLGVYREAYFLDWPILVMQSGDDKFLMTKGMEFFLMGVKKNLLTEKNYSKLKHDLYNEKDKEQVFNDIIEWIGTHEKIY